MTLEQQNTYGDPAGPESNLSGIDEHFIENDLAAAIEEITGRLQETIKDARAGAHDVKSQAHDLFPSPEILTPLDTTLDNGINGAADVLMSAIHKV